MTSIPEGNQGHADSGSKWWESPPPKDKCNSAEQRPVPLDQLCPDGPLIVSQHALTQKRGRVFHPASKSMHTNPKTNSSDMAPTSAKQNVTSEGTARVRIIQNRLSSKCLVCREFIPRALFSTRQRNQTRFDSNVSLRCPSCYRCTTCKEVLV